MKNLLIIFVIYLIVINIIAFSVTVSDKIRAVKGKWRIMESTLFCISFLGGSIVMYLTMLLIRHKTGHKRFMLGIPAIIIVQCAAAFVFWRVFYA